MYPVDKIVVVSSIVREGGSLNSMRHVSIVSISVNSQHLETTHDKSIRQSVLC